MKYSYRCPSSLTPCPPPSCRLQKLELGLGRPPAFSHPLSYPRSPGMAIIRPAAPPYSDGLFVSMCLPRKAAAALRRHPLLPALLPEARWVGGDGGQAAQ